MLEESAARMAAGVRSSHLTDDRDAPSSPREQEAQALWSGLTSVLQVMQQAESDVLAKHEQSTA